MRAPAEPLAALLYGPHKSTLSQIRDLHVISGGAMSAELHDIPVIPRRENLTADVSRTGVNSGSIVSYQY